MLFYDYRQVHDNSSVFLYSLGMSHLYFEYKREPLPEKTNGLMKEHV